MSLIRGSGSGGGGATEEGLGKIFPDNLDDFRFSFVYRNDTGKVALIENMPDDTQRDVDVFGSLLTDRFVSNSILGGLQYQHSDGYRYHHVRASTGDTKSAVFNNYDSQALVATNSKLRVIQNTEVENQREDVGVTDTATITRWSTDVTAVNGELVNKIKFTTTANGTYIARHWWNDSNGDMVGETVSAQAWNAVPSGTVSAEHLEFLKHHDAVEVVFDGSGEATLPVSSPLAIEGGDMFTHHIEFKEALPVTVHTGTTTPFVTVEFTDVVSDWVTTNNDLQEVNSHISNLEWLIYSDLHQVDSLHARDNAIITTRADEIIIWNLT